MNLNLAASEGRARLVVAVAASNWKAPKMSGWELFLERSGRDKKEGCVGYRTSNDNSWNRFQRDRPYVKKSQKTDSERVKIRRMKNIQEEIKRITKKKKFN